MPPMPAMPGMPGMSVCVESCLVAGIPVDFAEADLGGADLAFVAEAFFVVDRDRVTAFFLTAVAALRFEGVAGFAFFVGAPIFIPGMLDMALSCPACCGCWARAGALAISENTTSANARREAWGEENENIVHPKFECGAPPSGGRQAARARNTHAYANMNTGLVF